MDIRKTVGRRTQRPIGELRAPTLEERDWVEKMAQRRTRVPKGVFRYKTMAEANADREKWDAELVAATIRETEGR